MAIGAMQGKTAPFDLFWGTPTSDPQPCRDRFGLNIGNLPQDHVIAFAVADGISSQPNSDLGAQSAIEAAIEALQHICRDGSPDKAAFERVFEYAYDRVDQVAKTWGCPISSCGTTLVAGVLDTRDGGLFCASVGDGFVIGDNGQNLWWFPRALDLEPTGATFSLTDPSWRKVMNYDWCRFPVSTVFAFTDGLQHVMFEVNRENPNRVVRNPHRKAIKAIREAVLESENVSRTRNLATLLGLRNDAKLMADDRTVVIIQRLDKKLPISSGQNRIGAVTPAAPPRRDPRPFDFRPGQTRTGSDKPGVAPAQWPELKKLHPDWKLSAILVLAILSIGFQALQLLWAARGSSAPSEVSPVEFCRSCRQS